MYQLCQQDAEAGNLDHPSRVTTLCYVIMYISEDVFGDYII